MGLGTLVPDEIFSFPEKDGEDTIMMAFANRSNITAVRTKDFRPGIGSITK
jgi:hypothetical protein